MATIYEKAYLEIVVYSSFTATQGFLNQQRQQKACQLTLPDVALDFMLFRFWCKDCCTWEQPYWESERRVDNSAGPTSLRNHRDPQQDLHVSILM